MQHRPLLGQVLPGRQPGGVVARGSRTFRSAFDLNTLSSLGRDGNRYAFFPARRPRAYVRVQGSDAVDYLNRMLSNDVPEAGSVDALLLTPKARVIAPVLVWRRGADDVLLLTEPELGEPLLSQLTRMRFAAKCEITARSAPRRIVFGDSGDGIPNRDYGASRRSKCSTPLERQKAEERAGGRCGIAAATPRSRPRDRGARRPARPRLLALTPVTRAEALPSLQLGVVRHLDAHIGEREAVDSARDAADLLLAVHDRRFGGRRRRRPRARAAAGSPCRGGAAARSAPARDSSPS